MIIHHTIGKEVLTLELSITDQVVSQGDKRIIGVADSLRRNIITSVRCRRRVACDNRSGNLSAGGTITKSRHAPAKAGCISRDGGLNDLRETIVVVDPPSRSTCSVTRDGRVDDARRDPSQVCKGANAATIACSAISVDGAVGQRHRAIGKDTAAISAVSRGAVSADRAVGQRHRARVAKDTAAISEVSRGAVSADGAVGQRHRARIAKDTAAKSAVSRGAVSADGAVDD